MNDINKQIFTIDTSVARPHDFQIFRGETVGVECRFNNYIEPLDLTGMTATLYWRSPDMAASGDSWYSGDASVSANKATFTWVPSADAGADEYEWYLKVAGDGASYRAFGLIEMLGSPSTNPSIGPTPQSNYYTKDETDEAIAEAISEIPAPVYPVTSVNGKTGAVVLSASDVGALPSTYVAPVASVNGKTGAVVLSASDVGAAPAGNYALLSDIPDVVAPTSEAVTGQAADAEATWTSLSGLDENITQARIQMALADGAFALPQTVVEFYDGHTELLTLSDAVTFETLSAALGPTPNAVKRITFGTDVTFVKIGPNYQYSNTNPVQFILVDDEQTVLAKQDYLHGVFYACESIEIPLNLRGFGFDLGGDILDYSYAGGNASLTEYTIKANLGEWGSTTTSLFPFAFSGWKALKKIVYPFGYDSSSDSGSHRELKVQPHFIDNCTSLEVLDLRYTDITPFSTMVLISGRPRRVSVEPTIQNVNPNLKIIVRDDVYTRLMANSLFTTWQPYLVKVSDWEYVHHYEISAYATSTEVATAISTATSGLATQTALTTAISAVEAEIPEVVSPYTSNSSGKAADAKDTGNALKTKATSFQPYRISNCVIQDNYWHNIRMFLDETNEIGIVFNGTGFVAFGWPDDTVHYETSYDSFDDILTVTKNGTDYSYSVYYSVVATLKDIPRGETWNFTLEDGTVLTKSVAVY